MPRPRIPEEFFDKGATRSVLKKARDSLAGEMQGNQDVKRRIKNTNAPILVGEVGWTPENSRKEPKGFPELAYT